MEKTKEYTVIMKSGEVYVLTIKEKKYLIENEDKRFVDFPGVGTINPAWVDSIREDKIDVLKDRFPCKACFRSGVMKVENNFTPCTTCGGTGADIKE